MICGLPPLRHSHGGSYLHGYIWKHVPFAAPWFRVDSNDVREEPKTRHRCRQNPSHHWHQLHRHWSRYQRGRGGAMTAGTASSTASSSVSRSACNAACMIQSGDQRGHDECLLYGRCIGMAAQEWLYRNGDVRFQPKWLHRRLRCMELWM